MSELISLTERPSLRWPLRVERVSDDGAEYLVLIDPEEISPAPLIVPVEVGVVLQCCDGSRTVEELLSHLSSYGLNHENFTQLYRTIDEALFFNTPRVEQLKGEVLREYLDSPVRKEALVEKVYPAHPELLKDMLSRYLKGRDVHFSAPKDTTLSAIIAPHIDYRRGAKTYGAIFHALSQYEKPDIILLMGTSHQPSRGVFHLSAKDFATPLGTFKASKEFFELFLEKGGQRFFTEEFLHRKEHSLELQLPFLAQLYEDTGPLPTIIPVLVGSFFPFLLSGSAPTEEPEVAQFLDILEYAIRTLSAQGRRILLFGGVDLAHVGKSFGDSQSMSTPETLLAVRERDRALLDSILVADYQRLYEHIAQDNDARRICGFPSIYTMLVLLSRLGVETKGTLVEYRQAVDVSSDTVVTFAGAVWHASKTGVDSVGVLSRAH